MNPDHLCAPCDGLLSVYPINDEGTVLPIKQSVYTIASLLKDKELAAEYSGGWCLVFRLCVDNYHRYAYPVSGPKGPNIFIPGILHTVRPTALETFPVFAQNCREYTLIEGNAPQRLQIRQEIVGRHEKRNLEQEGKAERGIEKGYFEYGGSTVILLVEKDKLQVNKNYFETPVKMGQCIGTLLK